MLKKLVVGGLIIVLVVMIGGFVWVRSVLGGDGVRTAIAGQMSKALGQPVTIGRINATAYPRVTVNLGDVRIGDPARVQVSDLHIGTDFRALLSRRIEHASLRLRGAKIELPLPPFTGLTSSAPDAHATGSPVELVSIDEIVLSDVQIESGGRTLRGDVEVVPRGQAVLLRKMTLTAEGATIAATGQITDLTGPVGEINLKADTLNFDQLIAFANDFSGGAGIASAANATTPEHRATEPKIGPASPGAPELKIGPTNPSPRPPAPDRAARPSAMNVTLSLETGRATMGQLVLEKLAGRARITAKEITLDPARFGIFAGQYEGSLVVTLGDDVPDVRVNAKLTGIDVAAATRFAGTPDTITGRLSGRIEFSGHGADATALTRSARGTVRVDVTDGIVRNLGLVQAVVVATSMRSGSSGAPGALSRAGGSKDEPFSKLGATLTIANGAVTTNDLSFVSKDLNLSAEGVLHLSAATVDLRGNVQLSDALSQQAGRDLVRYTQEQGRVTLPATITGPSNAPSVRIDAGDMAQRAIKNAATEQAQKRIKGGLSGLLKR